MIDFDKWECCRKPHLRIRGLIHILLAQGSGKSFRTLKMLDEKHQASMEQLEIYTALFRSTTH